MIHNLEVRAAVNIFTLISRLVLFYGSRKPATSVVLNVAVNLLALAGTDRPRMITPLELCFASQPLNKYHNKEAVY